MPSVKNKSNANKEDINNLQNKQQQGLPTVFFCFDV